MVAKELKVEGFLVTRWNDRWHEIKLITNFIVSLQLSNYIERLK